MLIKKLVPLLIEHAIQIQLVAMGLDATQHDLDETAPILMSPLAPGKVSNIAFFYHGFTSSTGLMKGFMDVYQQYNPHAYLAAIPLTGHCKSGLPGGSENKRYSDQAEQMATFLPTLKDAFDIPIDLIGVSGGATMISSIAYRLPPETLNSFHAMAPYFNPYKVKHQIFMNALAYLPPIRQLFNSMPHHVTGDARVPHFFPDSSVGQIAGLHAFTYDAWPHLEALSKFMPYVYMSTADTVVSPQHAVTFSERTGATVLTYEGMNHCMPCTVRNTPGQIHQLVRDITFNSKQG